MLDRIVVGTANWAQEYNGHKVSEKEQQLIMEYMKEVGIEWLDVAEAYGTEYVGKGEFSRVVKMDYGPVRPIPYDSDRDIVITHSNAYFIGSGHAGYSVDSVTQIPLSMAGQLPRYIEFPYSILNKNKGIMMLGGFVSLIARSIFCKGKALKYFTPQECIDFVLMNPRIDKVIIGVDSVDQLKENVSHLVKMERFTHTEEVDTRKFERKDL